MPVRVKLSIAALVGIDVLPLSMFRVMFLIGSGQAFLILT